MIFGILDRLFRRRRSKSLGSIPIIESEEEVEVRLWNGLVDGKALVRKMSNGEYRVYALWEGKWHLVKIYKRKPTKTQIRKLLEKFYEERMPPILRRIARKRKRKKK